MAGNNRMTGQQTPTAVAKYTFAASIAVAVGDAMFRDATAGTAKPMTSFTWTTDLATTRFNAARLFAGLSNERRLSSETDTPEGVVNSAGEALMGCAALGAAYPPGTLVTFAQVGATEVLSATNVAVTTDPSLAIGKLSRPAGSGATQVYVNFESNVTNQGNGALTIPNTKLVSGTAATLGATDIAGAHVTTYINTGNNATLTLPTAAAMLAAVPGGYVGMQHMLMIRNTHATTATLTADAGPTFTLTGTMTIAQNTTRIFNVNLTSASAATITSLGTGAAAA